MLAWRPRSPSDSHEGLGVQNATEIRFPLDPRKQLVLTPRPVSSARNADPARVRDCNAEMTAECFSQLIAAPAERCRLDAANLRDRRPILRFAKRPYEEVSESGQVASGGGDLLHMWLPRGAR